MHFELGNYYHFFNRTNNEELLFKSESDYEVFLRRYRRGPAAFVSTIAYCLMPTHFHFLIRITTNDYESLTKKIAVLLSGYTRYVNRRYKRHGSLFQPRSKAKIVTGDQHMLRLIFYIHQNPLRAGCASKLDEWAYSSYRDLIGGRNGTLPDRHFIMELFGSVSKFKKYSEGNAEWIKREYWM